MMLRSHAGAAAVLTALLSLAGCDEGQAFYIVQNQAPTTGCSTSTDETVYRARGLLDVSMGEGYMLYPLLLNDLPARKLAGDNSTRVEPNLLQLREFRVTVDLGDIAQVFAPEQLKFTRPTSGSLAPGAKRSSVVEVLPAGLVQKLVVAGAARPTVVVRVVAVAQSGDGGTTESLAFYYPITLCNGCLVKTLDSCTGADAQTSANNVCGLPQDAPLVCCKDGGNLSCPAGTGGGK